MYQWHHYNVDLKPFVTLMVSGLFVLWHFPDEYEKVLALKQKYENNTSTHPSKTNIVIVDITNY